MIKRLSIDFIKLAVDIHRAKTAYERWEKADPGELTSALAYPPTNENVQYFVGYLDPEEKHRDTDTAERRALLVLSWLWAKQDHEEKLVAWTRVKEEFKSEWDHDLLNISTSLMLAGLDKE